MNILRRPTLHCVVLLCGFAMLAYATPINLGTLSYDTFVPASGTSPGVDAFDVSNLTGAFSLPPDFPVSTALAFQSVTVTLIRSDASMLIFNLGNIGPGFALDSSGNPLLQFSSSVTFVSAEFDATLSASNFTLSDGSTAQLSSAALHLVLSNSAGGALIPDIDNAALSVESASTPEPSAVELVLLGIAAIGYQRRRPRLGLLWRR